MMRQSALLGPGVSGPCKKKGMRHFFALIAQLWENEDLEVFPIFPSGVRYMPGKIRDKATFLIFLQNSRFFHCTMKDIKLDIEWYVSFVYAYPPKRTPTTIVA
ncbi:hypothetical protein DVH24_014191 [Malus domestica]|uniref:Uncharacterized protein n=1 Tax=Malus domestica TaxID=3750 RepID=A0A498JFJ3_MALDO|nr:hypothetical protein DVH24_014191 [Malus domestica]